MLPSKIWIICRVCLKQQTELYNIFENTSLENIWSILRDCGGVPVRRNDNFPDKICEICLKRLRKVNLFRMDCQRAHRDFVQKQLDWNADICEWELQNKMNTCTELSAVSDSVIKVGSSCSDDNSSSSTNTNEKSTITASTIRESIQFNSEAMNSSQTSLIENKQLAITTSLNFNETMNKFEEFTNNNDTEIPNAEDEIHNSIMKQYCVFTNKNLANQTGEQQQQNIEKPIVLRLKVKNKESNENIHTIGYHLWEANNNNETINQIAATKESNKVDMNVNTQKSPKSNKSSDSHSNEIKRNNNHLPCKTCKKKFKTFINLRHHMYTHNKPHKCNICHMRFSQTHALLSHNNNHTGIKPFYCRICFKSFADISNRNCHERSMHSQKKLKCSGCNKLFRFQTLLDKHTRSHQPKKCFICDKEFSTVQNIRSHHQRVHLKSLFRAKN